MYRRLCTTPCIRNVGNEMEASGQLSAPTALILVPLHWRPSGTDSLTRKWLTQQSWLLFKEMKEYRRKRTLFNAGKDTERKKERKRKRKKERKKKKERNKERRKVVTYECVGRWLSYSRIILFLLHFLLEHSCHKWKGIKSSCRLCSKYHRVIPKCPRIKEDKRGNVRITWQRGAFLQPLLKWKINTYYVSWVCICSLRYPACTAHARYCHLRPARLYNTVTHYPISGTTFGKTLLNVKCVIGFSLQHFNYHSKKYWARCDQKCTLVFM